MGNRYFIEFDYDYLYHSGILGMKWGVRRYQNSDGSYTEAGKKRYYKNYGEVSTIKAGSKVYRTTGDSNEQPVEISM